MEHQPSPATRRPSPNSPWIFESTPEAAKRVGSLRISATQAEQLDCEAQYAAMMASGLPVDRYDGPEGTGLIFPHDGTVQPYSRCVVLARRGLDGGARLFEESPVKSFEPGRLLAGAGSVICKAVLVSRRTARSSTSSPPSGRPCAAPACRCWRPHRSTRRSRPARVPTVRARLLAAACQWRDRAGRVPLCRGRG